MKEVWNKVEITGKRLTPQSIDLLSYQLIEIGCEGVQVEHAVGYLENQPNLFGEIPLERSREDLNQPTKIIGYYEGDITREEMLTQGLTLSDGCHLRISPLKMEAWYDNWKQYYQIEPLSRFVTIVPAWMTYEPKPAEHVIYLDPGLSFGTGKHPTTRLAAQLLELHMRYGDDVIDLGSGSGILTFIAASLGASSVRGYDIDPQAVESAQDNLKLQVDNKRINELSQAGKLTFQKNDLLSGITKPADLIVANILPHILYDMLGQAATLLKADGRLILGGILEEKQAFIEDALKEFNFIVVQRSHMSGWVSYIVQKEQEACKDIFTKTN